MSSFDDRIEAFNSACNRGSYATASDMASSIITELVSRLRAANEKYCATMVGEFNGCAEDYSLECCNLNQPWKG